MKRMILAAFVLFSAPMFLSGCGGGAFGAIAGGDLTDLVISRAAQFNDRALDDLEKAEDFLRQKAVRLARAKCLFPLAALIRYARASEPNRRAVERDCGLAIEPVAATVTKPPGGSPGGVPPVRENAGDAPATPEGPPE